MLEKYIDIINKLVNILYVMQKYCFYDINVYTYNTNNHIFINYIYKGSYKLKINIDLKYDYVRCFKYDTDEIVDIFDDYDSFNVFVIDNMRIFYLNNKDNMFGFWD